MQTRDSKYWFKWRCREKSLFVHYFFLPLDTYLSFYSFLVMRDDNLIPSLLSFMMWENVKPVLSELRAATGDEFHKATLQINAAQVVKPLSRFEPSFPLSHPSGIAVNLWPSIGQWESESNGIGVYHGVTTKLQAWLLSTASRFGFASSVTTASINNGPVEQVLCWHRPEELHFLISSVFLRLEWILLWWFWKRKMAV